MAHGNTKECSCIRYSVILSNVEETVYSVMNGARLLYRVLYLMYNCIRLLVILSNVEGTIFVHSVMNGAW